MNRDAAANLTISSPLEAHKSHCICYSIVGVDVGFENPTFACLEVDYEVSYSILFNKGRQWEEEGGGCNHQEVGQSTQAISTPWIWFEVAVTVFFDAE